MLQEKERRIRENPLKYLKQHEKQYEASNVLKAIRALFWGNRVGKTEWGAQETSRYALGETGGEVNVYRTQQDFIVRSFKDRLVFPPIEIWCASPSYDAQKETTQKKLELYIPKKRIVDITYVKKNTWGEIVIDNGTKLNFKSYEQGREKFQGVGKRLIWFDEEPPHDIWEECFVRSEAGVPLDIILTMTAIKGMTWVYDDIYMDTDNPNLYVSTAGWNDNPWLEDVQKKQMASGLTPDALKVREEGKFVKRVGMVCPWWERSTHLQDITYDSNWAISGAIDFGFSNPACFELIGADYDDNLNIFDGFYSEGMTTPTIGQEIIKLKNDYKIKSLEIIADSAQAQDIQELNDYFGSIDANITVIGIKKVSGTDNENWDEYRARKMQEYGQVVDGKTKIRVSNKLTRIDPKEEKKVNWFVKEVELLKWDEKKGPTDEMQQGPRWDPRYPNHSIDTFSYYLVDHLEAPERPAKKKPWEGKIPGTYVPPAIIEEETGWTTNQSEETDTI